MAQVNLSRLNDFIARAIENSRSRSNTSLSQIASGNRLVRAGVDAAGLAITEQIRSDIAALSQSVENTRTGVNFVNTAEGGLATITDLVGRGRELAVQASNGTLSDAQRNALNQEFTAIRSEINRISNVTEFNGQPLLNGNLGSGSANRVDIQVGTGAGPANQINLNVVEAANTQSLGIDSLNISTAQGALQALQPLEQAQQAVIATRGEIGAITNRLSVTANNLGNTIENLTRSVSQIAGTDIAREIANLQQSLQQTQLGIRALVQNQQNESAIGRLLDTSG